jgi:hypothetical protein
LKASNFIFLIHLNLSIFEKVFGSNLNFQLKFKISEKKIQKPFYFRSAAQTDFGPSILAARSFAVFIFPGCSLCAAIVLPARSALAGPLAHHPVTSFHLQPVATPPPHCSPAPSEVVPSHATSTLTPGHAPSGSPPLGAVSRLKSISPLKTIKPKLAAA